MNTRDESKASLVEFLRSIKFVQEKNAAQSENDHCPTHFAHFEPIAKGTVDSNIEDRQLIRSAN
ncbi:MAG: hypothetical protein ACI9DH_001812 [Halioglobus sp.]|jgi:hypothetical protein